MVFPQLQYPTGSVKRIRNMTPLPQSLPNPTELSIRFYPSTSYRSEEGKKQGGKVCLRSVDRKIDIMGI